MNDVAGLACSLFNLCIFIKCYFYSFFKGMAQISICNIVGTVVEFFDTAYFTFSENYLFHFWNFGICLPPL